MVPRLVLGLVAAASSLWWCALVLDVADAVSGFIAFSLERHPPGDMLRSTLSTLMTAVQAGSVGIALLLAALYLVYGFFVLYVIVQMILRLALIDILLALAPIALGLWILPHTAGWGRQSAAALYDDRVPAGHPAHRVGVGVRLPQGVRRDSGLRAGAGPDLEAAHVPGLRLHGRPGCRRCLAIAGTFDSWLSMLYFGMNLPSSLMRSARTIGLVAGGAAGGPGGMAVGAMAASAGLSAAGSGLSSAASMATPSGGGGDGGEAPRSSDE